MADFKLSFRAPRKRGAVTSLDEIADEIRSVDEAAERASRRIDQSARRLRSSGHWHEGSNDDVLGELAAALATRAGEIRAEWSRLSGMVERARRLVGEDRPEPVEDVPAPRPAPAVNGASELPAGHQGLRLIATQMAISGSTRAEIEAHLRDEFGAGDVATLLDEIFGVPQAGARR